MFNLEIHFFFILQTAKFASIFLYFCAGFLALLLLLQLLLIYILCVIQLKDRLRFKKQKKLLKWMRWESSQERGIGYWKNSGCNVNSRTFCCCCCKQFIKYHDFVELFCLMMKKEEERTNKPEKYHRISKSWENKDYVAWWLEMFKFHAVE